MREEIQREQLGIIVDLGYHLLLNTELGRLILPLD